MQASAPYQTPSPTTFAPTTTAMAPYYQEPAPHLAATPVAAAMTDTARTCTGLVTVLAPQLPTPPQPPPLLTPTDTARTNKHESPVMMQATEVPAGTLSSTGSPVAPAPVAAAGARTDSSSQRQDQNSPDRLLPIPKDMEIVMADSNGIDRKYKVTYSCYQMTRSDAKDFVHQWSKSVFSHQPPRLPPSAKPVVVVPAASAAPSSSGADVAATPDIRQDPTSLSISGAPTGPVVTEELDRSDHSGSGGSPRDSGSSSMSVS